MNTSCSIVFLAARSSKLQTPGRRFMATVTATTSERFDYEKIRNEIIDYWMKSESASPNGKNVRARYCCFTLYDAHREYYKPSAKWHWLDRELSSNVAGETGAVHIYKGALAALKLKSGSSSKAIEFCHSHMAIESSHLRMFESVVPKGKHTRLLPVWRLAGWTLGFLPTLVGGNKALHVTVQAVETFVEEHFQDQISPLKSKEVCPELTRLLEHCCEDEVHHKEDAAKHLLNGETQFFAWWVGPWSRVVGRGSAFAAEVARRI